jgi:hypothetical protein
MPSISAYQAAGYDFSLLANQNTDTLQVGELQNEIINYNNSEFKDQFGPSLNASTSAINTGRLVGRNASLSDMSEQLIRQNKHTENTYITAKDTYSRQGEINEWQAQNKLDTLFFLQILFLYFSLVIVLVYLRQSNFLSNSTTYTTIGVGLLIVIGILWNRVSYTNINRDSRYWNRRYITGNPVPVAPAPAECVTGVSGSPSPQPQLV